MRVTSLESAIHEPIFLEILKEERVFPSSKVLIIVTIHLKGNLFRLIVMKFKISVSISKINFFIVFRILISLDQNK
jgi:hypothetical protein